MERKKELPKLWLDGNETLNEIQTLMRELKLAEAKLTKGGEGPGSSGTDSFAAPDALLEDDALMVEDVLTSGEVDMSRLTLPNALQSCELYPEDFNIPLTDPGLLAIRYNLMNYVKAVINEESLSKFFFPGEPSTERAVLPLAPSERHGMKPQRKDSYTITRHNVPARATTVPTIDTTTVSPRLPCPPASANTLLPPKSNGIMDKTYSTHTYSKKSSPFAVPAPKRHPSIPFVRNGNTVDDDANINVRDPGIDNRTITRPSRHQAQSRVNGDGYKGASELPTQNLQVQPPVKSKNLSMEEIQSLARLQQESLLSSTGSTGFVVNRTFTTHDMSQTSSFEEDDCSGSTGNGAWSNDTYSVGVSNPPSESETSSGISSPPAAGSCEDVQLASLRRSMPNLGPKSLSLAPTYSGKLQKEAHYNSDLKLSQNRCRTRTLRAPTVVSGDTTFTLDSGRSDYQEPIESNLMEPLKKALVRADTYLQGERKGDRGANMNGYATYQVRKPSMLKPPLPVSRLPTAKNAFGYNSGTHQEPSLSLTDSGTPPTTGRRSQHSGLPPARHPGPQ